MTRSNRAACSTIALVVAVAFTGCSFMTMERATVRDASQLMPICTQSIKPVIADGLGLVFWSWIVATEARGALDSYEEDGQLNDQFYGALTGVVAMVAHVGSGLWGYRAQDRCRVARYRHEQEIRGLREVSP